MFAQLFNNSATIEIKFPNRASLNTQLFFPIVLTHKNFVLPLNVPLLSQNTKYSTFLDLMPKQYLTYSSTNLDVKNRVIEGITSFNQQTDFWGSLNYINLPYLPYFSNCVGYGKYIPFWALFEQNPGCILKGENETVYITDYSFGSTAFGDECDILINCAFDEDMEKNNDNFWWNAPNGFTLFSVSQNPISFENFNQTIDSTNLINVIVNSNTIPNNQIPQTIVFKISYFQTSITDKSIVAAQIDFQDIINFKPNNTIIYNYNLLVKYIPLKHTDLMVLFSLSYTFYLVLYSIQGFIVVLMTFIFYFYHSIMSRISPKPKFKFYSILKLIIPPSIYGFVLAMIPIWIVLIVIAYTISGSLFLNQLNTFYCNPNLQNCQISIFANVTTFNTIDPVTLNYVRVDMAIFALGVYLYIRGIILMIPKEKTFHKLSYDYNIWDFFTWKRLNFMFYTILLIGIFIYSIILSYVGQIWSANIWTFIFAFKIFGIIFENVIGSKLKDEYLTGVINISFTIIQTLLTFGAPNLIIFFVSNIIDSGSQLIERTYVENIINLLYHKVFSKYSYYKSKLISIFKFEEENEETNKKEESKDEAEDNKEDNKEDVDENNLYNKPILLNIVKNKSENKDEEVIKNEENEEFNPLYQDEVKNVELIISRIGNYTRDLLSYFFNIFLYAFLWTFYNETQVLNGYGVYTSNFIFFFYFVLIIVPFNIIIDVIYYNLIEKYDGILMYDYLNYLNWRFSIRECSWASFGENNTKLDEEYISLEKLCFSSQYYFILTIFTSGLFLITIGLIGIMTYNYNIFGDLATLLILIYIFFVSYITEKFCIFCAKLIKLWNVDKIKQDDIDEKEERKLDITLKKEKTDLKLKDFQKIKNWEKIKYVKEQEDLLMENLITEKMMLETTRNKFLNSNKKWLQMMLNKIITPRTLVINKEKILKIMQKKFKKKKVNLSDHLSLTDTEVKNENDYKYSFSPSETSIKIIHFWRKKNQLNKYLLELTKLISLQKKKSFCNKCGTNANIRCVVKSNLFEILKNFIKKRENMNFDELDFKLYFKNNAIFVTICSKCEFE